MTDPGGAAYARALEEHGLEDVQPRYRQLLLRLKGQDESLYDAAVARYRTAVEPEAAAATNPLEVWLAYGAWLALQIAPGELVTIRANGRAEPAEAPPPVGPMLIHLPSTADQRGFLIAMPTKPSDAQAETAALLCD